MLTKSKIHAMLRKRDLTYAADDGFDGMQIVKEEVVTACPFNPKHTVTDFRFTFHRATRHLPSDAHLVREHTAEAMYRELYGDLQAGLQRLGHEAQFATREEIIRLVDGLLESMQGGED